MSNEKDIEKLFRDHSLDEIETVKGNLAVEIEKRTNKLKSIVKEKYRDIVETSDTIQSMKSSLKDVEQSIWSLDNSISEFYVRIKQPQNYPLPKCLPVSYDRNSNDESDQTNSKVHTNSLLKKLIEHWSLVWHYFDEGNLKLSVKLLKESQSLIDQCKKQELTNETMQELDNIANLLNRADGMIKNNLWYKIYSAGPDQIGIIAGGDNEDLYEISFQSCIDFLIENLHKDISDNSYRAQISRYQECSYFDCKTNDIVPPGVDLSKTTSYIQIPKYISKELDNFLYQVCRVINTIAGFDLNKSSIVDSLKKTMEGALSVYSDIAGSVESLDVETKGKRAFQIYFDLLYLRILLNTSKNTDLIEILDPKLTELTSHYESMLDSIELIIVSNALHLNVMNLSQSTIRLYGLILPHLRLESSVDHESGIN